MRDELDLEALAQQAIPPRSSGRRNRAILMVVVVIAALVWPRLTDTPGRLYHFEDGSWHETELAGAPIDIRIDPSDAIWVTTEVRDGLSYYDGERWHDFDDDVFQVDDSYLTAGIALDGADLWGASGDTVIHYDGEQWESFPQTLPEGYATSLIAGDYGVYVIDDLGEIAHFDGQQWTTQPVWSALPGYLARIGPDERRYDPVMIETPSGDVWLEYSNIWRLDEGRWVLVRPFDFTTVTSNTAVGYVPDYRLVGADDDHLWIQFDNRFEIVDTNGTLQLSFDLVQMGLSNDAVIHHAVVDDGLLLLATSEDIVTFDGDTWRPFSVALPDDDGYHVFSLALDQGGRLWAASTNPRVSDSDFRIQYIVFILSPFVIVGLLLIVMLFRMTRYMQSARYTTMLEHPKQRLHQILPEMPDYPRSRSSGYRKFLFLIAFLIVAGFFIDIPNLLVAIGIFVFFIADMILPRLSQLRNASLESEQRAYLRRMLIYLTLISGLLFGFMVLTVIVASSIVNKLLGPQVWSIIVVVAVTLVIAAYIISYMYTMPVIFIYHRALAAGNYDAALRQSNVLRRWIPANPHFHFLYGYILMLAGRDVEAEQEWRSYLRETQNHSATTIAPGLMNLGMTLNSQERHKEAFPIVVGALELDPADANGYLTLADYYINHDAHLDRALELTEYMLRYAKKPRTNIFLGRVIWCQQLATRARALAAVQRFDEAEAVIEQALRETAQKFKPGVAALHYNLGHIKMMQYQSEAARVAFQHALELDPDGAAGNRAAKALADLDGDSQQEDD